MFGEEVNPYQEETNVQAEEVVEEEQMPEVGPELPGGAPVGITKDLMSLAQAASSGEADTILKAVEQFSKSQLVRFMDITVIGPILLYWAYKGKLSITERTILGLIGAGTLVYNGRNFLKNRGIMKSTDIVAIKDELSERIQGG